MARLGLRLSLDASEFVVYESKVSRPSINLQSRWKRSSGRVLPRKDWNLPLRLGRRSTKSCADAGSCSQGDRFTQEERRLMNRFPRGFLFSRFIL